MKKFTTEEIRDLYNRFCSEEISFSEMVMIMNQRVSEAEDIPEKPKKGDLAIFWDSDKSRAFIGKYNDLLVNGSPCPHQDSRGHVWKNAIKFESKEQYERLIKGEI